MLEDVAWPFPARSRRGTEGRGVSEIASRSASEAALRRTSVVVACLVLPLSTVLSSSRAGSHPGLEVGFEGGYGQVEIGGKYVGVEFHQSRPLPSRISFYYPVPNSIDLSTDYWKRYESLPYTVVLGSEGKTDTIGANPYPYRYTPYRATFEDTQDDLQTVFSYDVCEDLPVLVLRIELRNLSDRRRDLWLETSLNATLRTSHTYAWRKTASIRYSDSGAIATAAFDEADTDSALVFVANVGELRTEAGGHPTQPAENRILSFRYETQLSAGEQIEIVQLIGACRQNEQDRVLEEASRGWQASVLSNEARILGYAYDHSYFFADDPILQQTAHWSKAVLASNIHYIDGSYVPMPCPAEYNFFFTHDLLLTSLGAVYYDLEYVRQGLHFLHSLTKEDSILPHAYYWKDGQFVTEFCGSDNWNHLWLITLAASYLRHSADYETLRTMLPTLKKSLRMMLQNKGEDDLMYARRPDWWDTGDVYGARAYITALTCKALHEYTYLAEALEGEDASLLEYLQLADRMKEQLSKRLWDSDAGFLLNEIGTGTIDRHYYSGSLVAAWFGLLDGEKSTTLLQTARSTLLDEHLGIRNAMPPDFHELISAYGFKGMESGMPYYYLNGAVWPHGNAWYALALLSRDQPTEAKDVLKSYLTLEGIRNSPNGQPSFYECRTTDPRSDRYGEIDKPTFLWAGGWYLHVLYQLAGVRENAWSIYFSPRLPSGFANTAYDLTLLGESCRVRWRGEGDYFRRIQIDGEDEYSAVILAPAKDITLKRGLPETPYLAEANCRIRRVAYSESERKSRIAFSAILGQVVDLAVVTPYRLGRCELNGSPFPGTVDEVGSEGAYTYALSARTASKNNELTVYFE
jgi:hypothetical protein